MKYLLTLLLISSSAFASSIKKVDIYANCDVKVNSDYSVPITVYHLGCDDDLTKKLRSLMANATSKEDIKKISKDFLNKNKEKYKQAFKAKAVMAFQKVDRYPAVVFNDKYVVYGTSDYEVAKDRYYAYKG